MVETGERVSEWLARYETAAHVVLGLFVLYWVGRKLNISKNMLNGATPVEEQRQVFQKEQKMLRTILFLAEIQNIWFNLILSS